MGLSVRDSQFNSVCGWGSLVTLMQGVEGSRKVHSPPSRRVHYHLPARVLYRPNAAIQQILQWFLYALHCFLQTRSTTLS